MSDGMSDANRGTWGRDDNLNKPAATGSGEPKCPKCGNGNVNIRTTNFINSDEFDPHVASGTEAHCYSSSCGYDGPVAEFMPTPPASQPTVTLDVLIQNEAAYLKIYVKTMSVETIKEELAAFLRRAEGKK